VSDPYTADEVSEIRTQAVWFPTDTRCPRHDKAMDVAKTVVQQQDSPVSMLVRTVDGWPVTPGWDRTEVELRCESCDESVRAKTGPLPQLTWAKTLGVVREGILKRNRDPRIVGFDQRTLKITIPLPVTTGAENLAYHVPWDALALPAAKIADDVLAAYDQAVERLRPSP